MTVQYRVASVADASVIALMNAQLIHDEGHRNAMTTAQLTERMAKWLRGDYHAYLFELESKTIGYALYRLESEHVYLRQLYVEAVLRRRGIAREALGWLRLNVWRDQPRVRIDVLVGNRSGIEFWRSVGFTDYCMTMESPI